jgi:predicted exporter
LDKALRGGLSRADRGKPSHVLVWLLIMLLLSGGAALRVITEGGSPVSSDVLSLLPQSEGKPLLKEASDQNDQSFLHSMIFAIEGDSMQSTTSAARAALDALLEANYTPDNPGAKAQAVQKLYRRHRFRLLTPKDERALARAPATTFITRLQVGLASPGSPAGTITDPGGFLTRYLASLPRPFSNLEPAHGLLTVPDAAHPTYLLMLQLKGDAFGLAGETRAQKAAQIVKTRVADKCGHCSVAATAPALFSAAERRETKSEVNWLGIAATLIIVLLVLTFFRSLRPLGLVIVCVGGGIVGGGALTLLVFGRVNLITMVFGTTLLGISVDYALHYLSERYLNESRQGPSTGTSTGTLARIGPAVLTALATTCIAFAFLAAAPFPALRQMALFSIVGLVSAFLTVCAVFPLFSRRMDERRAPPIMHRAAHALLAGGKRWRLLLTLILVVGAAGGLARLQAKDDLTELQAMPPALVKASAHIFSLIGASASSNFFLVQGPNLATALERERALTRLVARKAPDVALFGLSSFLPAPDTQARAHAAWAPLMRHHGKKLKQALAGAGLPSAFAKDLIGDWQQASGPLTANELIQILPTFAHQVVRGKQATGLIVQAYGAGETAEPALRAIAAQRPGVTWVEPLEHINATFTRIREQATFWVIVGYALTFLLLAWRFGLRGGLATLLSPLIAASVTLGILGWLGASVNIFVMVGLMLVAGIGVDYSVFLREGGARKVSTSFAVTLAAATTLASFGLLGASAIPALHVFGLTVGIGIFVSWLIAPLTASLANRKPV